MKKPILKILLPIALACCCHSAHAQLIINEIMQSNIDCIIDDLNEFPDSWVELYNSGPQTANLEEYAIAIANNPAKAYALPRTAVAPGEHIVIYCDKAKTGLHSNFRLDSGKGGAVYLFHSGALADKLENLKKQPAPNIAYGRVTDGADSWGYQAEPTPARANCGIVCKEILGEPAFSEKGRVADKAFSLELGLPSDAPADAVIRYTLNGDEPSEQSAIYQGPIAIDKTTVVRAKAFCQGYLSPRSSTHSYIFHPRALTLPLVSIVAEDDYFYGEKEGILVKGSYTPDKPNFEYDWRRPINIEYFVGEDAESSINQLCETRVKGGATRAVNALKSLAVYANKRFGTKRFAYEFFSEQTPGIDEFKSFELRNSGNDFDYLYMRDAIIQQCMGMNADLDWQPSQPAIIYINGTYKGLLNLRPRSNEDNIYSYHDGLEDIDMIENWWELKEGDIDSFNDFKDFYAAKGHTFSEFESRMDVGEYCNYMIMNLFFDNKDFPGNNMVMWRPQADGGRWRWVAKDTDFGLGLFGGRYKYPTLNWITTAGYDNNLNSWANQPDHTRLFRRLLDTDEFKDMLIDRSAIYLGDFLRPEKITERIDKRYDEIKDEYAHHRALINPDWPNHAQEVQWAKTWAANRWGFFYDHIQSFFRLNRPALLTVDKGAGRERTIEINGIALRSGQFDGKYFPGRKLTVKSTSDTDGKYVSGWEVKVTDGQSSSTQTYHTETLDITMPAGTSVEIKSILADSPLSVTDITDDIDRDMPCEVYDISGRRLGQMTAAEMTSALSPGIYVLRQGASAAKITIR